MSEKKLGLNPFLPEWEFIPDAEPHVFNDRVYIYGSHDKKNGKRYCEEDYVGWSAPIDDLGNWCYEGIIYKRTQDPDNKDGKLLLFAPDVAQGTDGRYYLYYGLDATNIIGVAVCDKPAGKYEYLGRICYRDGSIPKITPLFDPAVLCENGEVYLYFGFCPAEHYPGMPKEPFEGAMMVKLEKDMMTIKTEPVCVAKGIESTKIGKYKEHPFYEASSIRHFGEWYYFVYSSLSRHELCYAMGKYPEGPFEYKGVIISNGDIGYKENMIPTQNIGNNHGGIECINGEYYIFYHRHTHGTEFSRQACAEKIEIKEDGSIAQVGMTSCGLNNGSFPVNCTYSTRHYCYLTGKETNPYLTEESTGKNDREVRAYITNLKNESVCGFKFMDFDSKQVSQLSVCTRGVQGSILLSLDEVDNVLLKIEINESKEWKKHNISIPEIHGLHAIYFTVLCDNDAYMEFEEFSFF